MTKIAKFLDDISGNVAILFSLATVPLLIAVGAAVDYVHSYDVRTVLQGASDAAAIAGATSGKTKDADLQKIVQDYLSANGAIDAASHIDKIEQVLDPDAGTFTVSIKGTVDTHFMFLMGISKMNVSARAQVGVGSTELEVALVLDNTGSMKGSKIDNLKSASKELVDTLFTADMGLSSVRVGVVPFSEYVNVGSQYAGEQWVSLPNNIPAGSTWNGCVGSRNSPKDEQVDMVGGKYAAMLNVSCAASLLPLTADKPAVTAKIAAMVATGNTYIPAGLLWGWNLLDNGEPFAEAKSKVEMKKANGVKAIVLMTDGENTLSATYPGHTGKNTATTDTLLASLCETVKDDGIVIYTVSFKVPTQKIKNILTACATTPAQAYDADSGAELSAAFSEIANNLASVRLTQ